jgi:predicted TIM-barrel fold metal-dependent hydrolase
MVIDCDMHVIEPNAIWGGLAEWHGLVGKIGEQYAPHFADGLSKQLYESNSEPEPMGWGAYQEAMEKEGIDQAVFLPSRGLYITGLDDWELEYKLVDSYNEWIMHFVPAPNIPVAILNLGYQDVHKLRDMGFRAVQVSPNPVDCRPLHDDIYDPVWQALEDRNMPVFIHGGSHSLLDSAGAKWFSDNIAVQHMITHAHLGQLAVASFCAMGIFEKFPKLRVAFLECGSEWLPWWLDKLGTDAREFFLNQCFVAVEPGERVYGGLRYNYLYGSDFPHFDGKFPYSLRQTKRTMHAGMEKTILEDNPKRLLSGE